MNATVGHLYVLAYVNEIAVADNLSKPRVIDVLFEIRPKYLLIDEIEHLKPEYQS